jgi:hypothetical protein
MIVRASYGSEPRWKKVTVRVWVFRRREQVSSRTRSTGYFRPFTPPKKKYGNRLSVSRSIIENHRGRLWATPNDGLGGEILIFTSVR